MAYQQPFQRVQSSEIAIQTKKSTVMDTDKIEYYAKSITKELCDMPSFDVESITLMMKMRIGFLLHDVLKGKVSELESERAILVKEYNQKGLPGWRELELKTKLAALNVDVKKWNKSEDSIRKAIEYEQLKKFCREKMPPEVLDEYYELQKTLNLRPSGELKNKT